MRSWHDVNSVVNENLLGLIRDRYSIPKNYGLRAPRPSQRPYDPFPNGFGLITDALEAGLPVTLGYRRMPSLVGDLTIPDGVELLALSSGFSRGVSGGRD